MQGKLVAVVGVFIAMVSWLPLWIVTTYEPDAMPFGLGLLALAASCMGGVIALVSVIGLAIAVLRASRTRS